MSNAISAKNKPVEIKIGDEIYKIRFTLNSFIELETIYGSIDKAMEALQGDIVIDEITKKPVMVDNPDEKSKIKKVEKRNVNFKAVRSILWAGMIPDNPTITPIEVGNLLTFVNMTDIMLKVNEALVNSLPEKVAEEDGELKN
jgi:hypothetical protein